MGDWTPMFVYCGIIAVIYAWKKLIMDTGPDNKKRKNDKKN